MIDPGAESNNPVLRAALREATCVESPSSVEARVQRLTETYPHGIVPASDPAVASVPANQFNCFMYAFGLAGWDPAVICAQAKHIRPDHGFVEFLADRHLLHEQSTPHAGSIVLYWHDEVAQHAGIVQEGRVISKWGLDGRLWEHGLFEVPEHYGSTTCFYSPMSAEESRSSFRKYVESRLPADERSELPELFQEL